MTHHAVLGTLTARKHNLSDADIANKWGHLLEMDASAAMYSRLELAALRFARCFATDPKTYTATEYEELRSALAEHNASVYWEEAGWLRQVRAGRAALSVALASGRSAEDARVAARAAADSAAHIVSDAENEQKINSQVVELAFIALQFVALTGVFSSLNIPDEDFLRGVFDQVVPKPVREVVEGILSGTTAGMPDLIPARVELPSKEIVAGQVHVDPAQPRGRRIPLVSWEKEPAQGTRDKGLALGGIHVGVYGWSFGAYFPGSLTYALMHHGELARFEAPYSLPLLFNEDEWRNGTQTAGYNRPPLKELLIQKVYHLNRSRYGLEHHTMFFFNAILQSYGVGSFRLPGLTDEQHSAGLRKAVATAEGMILHIDAPRLAPARTYSDLQLALLDWVEAFVTAPHTAYRCEQALRSALNDENGEELAAGVRHLDLSGLNNVGAAIKRLVDHQIAELAMMAGHMDGLGRLLTILQLESELPVNIVQPTVGANNSLELQLTGAMNNRPGLFDALRFSFVPDSVLTCNELLANPELNRRVRDALGKAPGSSLRIGSETALETAEF
jgi:hypothetical protein